MRPYFVASQIATWTTLEIGKLQQSCSFKTERKFKITMATLKNENHAQRELQHQHQHLQPRTPHTPQPSYQQPQQHGMKSSWSARVEAYVRDLVNKYAPGVEVKNPSLYENALRHNSSSNERLEYLGDAVVYLAVASYLHMRYPKEDEAFMTRLRSKIVQGNTLSTLCLRSTKLGDFAAWHNSQNSQNSQNVQTVPPKTNKTNMMEDIFEAFLGALYEDQGFDVARMWVVGFLEDNLDFAQIVVQQDNYKDVFIRVYSRQNGQPPKYETIVAPGMSAMSAMSGMSGNVCMTIKHYTRIFDKDGLIIATGYGDTKQIAEQDASRCALQHIGISNKHVRATQGNSTMTMTMNATSTHPMHPMQGGQCHHQHAPHHYHHKKQPFKNNNNTSSSSHSIKVARRIANTAMCASSASN